MSRQLLFAAVCSLMIVVAGCGDGKSGDSGESGDSTKEEQTESKSGKSSGETSGSAKEMVEKPRDNWAELSGKVILDGEKPSPKIQTQNLAACKMHDKKLKVPVAEVGENNGIKNVFVWVQPKNGKLTKLKPELPPKEVTIDQKGCEFLPDSAILSLNGTLTVKNSDAGSHNFNYSGEFLSDNLNQEKGQTNTIEKLPESAQFVTFECNIHPWMKGLLRLAEHHAYALTSKDGSFNLGSVPPGEYTVHLHHKSRSDAVEKGTVTVTEDGSVEGLDLSNLTLKIKG